MDIALVVGANDMVNPAMRSDKGSPIYGVPILNADKVKRCFVVKCGDSKRCAGIVNALFYADNTRMVCGAELALLQKMAESIKSLGLAAAA